jgi:hypothetical protein
LAGHAGPVLVQLRHETELSSEDYVRQKAWLKASLKTCPLHPEGGCGFRKVGYYDRVEPAGLRVAFWHCPLGHRVFSLLPDFVAAHVSSSLVAIEQVVERFEQCRLEEDMNNEDAAACVGPAVERASAVRWVNRRRRWVQAALATAVGLLPVLAGCEPSLAGVRAVLGGPVVLVRLREIVTGHLAQMPAPLGFGPLPQARDVRLARPPYGLGPAPPPSFQ